ncbi:glycosyltransferase [Solibacillus silvestris]
MKLLFSYTGPLIKDDKGNYYSRTITDQLLSRYFELASEVSICTRVKEVSSEEELRKFTKINSNNLKIIECQNISSIKGQLIDKERVKRNLEELIKKSDIIVVRLPCVMGNIVIKLAEKAQKPFLVEVVGCPRDVYWNHSITGKVFALPSYYAMKKALVRSPYALYVTKNFLQNRYPCKGKTIGCSDVMLPILDNNILEKRLEKINNYKEGTPIIIGTTAAVNVRYKGQEYVIKAISRLIKEGYNFEYHLVGGGDQYYLRNLAEKYGIQDKVRFLGSLPHEKVFEYLDNIDIYIQPSITEGLPRALVEAMSRGCPSLGSQTGGIPELINKNLNFKARSVTEICTLLKKLTKANMIKEAQRSFNMAKNFNSEILNNKRSFFYGEFVKSALPRKDQ